MTAAGSAPSSTSLITEEMRRQYRDEGYFILERAVPEGHLELLRSVADFAVEKSDKTMDELGVDQIGINHRGKRYFSSMIYKERPELRQFLFSDLMADICRATLGDEAYL